ncbi:MAG: replication factor C small subunit [Candidatus Hydrothermarchaeales archaeon]
MIEAMWVEKYRPERIDEIVGQKEVVVRLKGYVAARNLPNMLFSGPPGTGKTTAAIALAKELFAENWRTNLLELNASDERGIDIVRGKIKSFARTLATGGGFKIIFLDEADALTKDAQHALRRTMEMYTTTCRFMLSCNYSSKIIEPIQSRCALFRFRPLKDEEMKSRLLEIADREGRKITPDGLEALLYASAGDMRRAINLLQSAASTAEELNKDVMYRIMARATPEEVREIMELAIAGKFLDSRTKLRDLMITYGMSGEDLVEQFHREAFKLPISEAAKVKLVDTIGEYDFRLVEGSNEMIQLEALLAQFAYLGENFGESSKL